LEIELSILISSWNNCSELDETLAAIRDCDRPTGLLWEVVVVNNNSTDDTASVLEKHKSNLPLVAVHEPRQGLSYGRNAAIRNARGKWFLFTDDDVRPEKGWIQAYVAAFRELGEEFFFGGPVTSIFLGDRPEPTLLSVATRAISGFSLEFSSPRETLRGFLSANWAAPADAVRKLGGFDVERGLNPERNEMRFGEEADLQVRLRAEGLKAVYLPTAEIGHIVPPEKCSAEYIFDRAEASALDLARFDPPGIGRFLRLLVSFLCFFSLYHCMRATGRCAHRLHYKWRVRRAKLRYQARELKRIVWMPPQQPAGTPTE
jgi:glycosyltransferase involved in cell wall biosynthesis